MQEQFLIGTLTFTILLSIGVALLNEEYVPSRAAVYESREERVYNIPEIPNQEIFYDESEMLGTEEESVHAEEAHDNPVILDGDASMEVEW